MPRILMRPPYDADHCPPTAFSYAENVDAADRGNYLWGNAAFAFGSVVIRAFASSGWFADIRGAHRDVEDGGLVTGLATHSFGTDPWGIALKTSTEVCVNDLQEKELCKLGLIPLCDCKDTGLSVFYTNQSVYEPKQYDDPAATASERMESMLQYTLCASRFAHFIKAIGQNKIGSFKSASEIETLLNNWLVKYVTSDSRATAAVKAKFPLRVGAAEVVDIPGEPGNYQVIMRLCPHYQLDQLHATIRLVPRITAVATS
jgi:type VI secretion system ImpC/EvpB family protein